MEEGRLSGFCIKAAGGNVNVDGTKCGRWNPTNEQLKILTDLFRSGVRTPTTDQIQKISNQLSFYGKIESKNVFYWFQNHKARERHKRRKLDDNFLVRNHQDNIHFSSPKYYARETKNNQVYLNQQSEAVIETLELFPLNSYGEKQVTDEKRRLINANEYYCKETTIDFQSEYLVTEIDHPPLDLRLSFI